MRLVPSRIMRPITTHMRRDEGMTHKMFVRFEIHLVKIGVN